MSILINDMEMPETCDECNFHRYHSGGEYVCVATPMLYPFNLANSKGIRKDWCPLVEVPAPHGWLIDEDNVIDAIHERLQELRTHKEFIKKHGDIDVLGVMPYIAKIPTVIEKEDPNE